MEDAPRALLTRVMDGDRQATMTLSPLVYDQLRSLAGRFMNEVSPGRVLIQRTALVHEAYLKLIGDSDVRSQTHFCAVAARVMREVLMDHLREQNRVKRGRGWKRITLAGAATLDGDAEDNVDVEALDAALRQLGDFDERAAEIVQLRFFGGLSEPEIADMLEVSERTVRSDWSMARAWLRTRLHDGEL